MAKKILVIDDNESILETLEIILQEYGYHVISSTNESIIESVQCEEIDAVLLDYQLGNTNGGEVAKKLRSKEATKGKPIIMISAYPNIRSIYKEIGANAFIAKPFDIDKLVNTVQSLIH